MPQDNTNPDDMDTDYDELDGPSSRFSMMTGTLVMIGVITLAIFTGVIWYAYTAGSDEAGQEGPPIIKAEQGESKVKPENPGGSNFAHQDNTVYDKIDGMEGGVEQLLPGTEEPKQKPRIISPYDNELPAGGQPKVVRVPPPVSSAIVTPPAEAPEVTAPEIADPMGRAKPSGEQDEAVAAEPAPEVTTQPEEEAGQTTASPSQESETGSAQPDAASTPDQAAKAEEATSTAALTPAPAPASGKAFVLQLGAFRTQEAADAGWKLLANRHEAILGALEHFITPADLGERGRFFRLQAGPFSERAAANDQCAALKSAGVDCLVAVR